MPNPCTLSCRPVLLILLGASLLPPALAADPANSTAVTGAPGAAPAANGAAPAGAPAPLLPPAAGVWRSKGHAVFVPATSAQPGAATAPTTNATGH